MADLEPASTASNDEKAVRRPSPLSLAFDHCPLALFAFLSDDEAGRVARALCQPAFLASRRYEIKATLPFYHVMAGRYPCVVRNVEYLQYKMEGVEVKSAAWRFPSVALSTVTRFVVCGFDEGGLDWREVLSSMPLLRELRRNEDRISPADLPRSLRTLMVYRLNQPFHQLPPHLTALRFEWDEDDPVQALNDLPASLTELVITNSMSGSSLRRPSPAEHGTVTLSASLTALDMPLHLGAALAPLPASLTFARFDYDGDFYSVPALRGASLRHLILPSNCSMPLRAADLPSLCTLYVPSFFADPLDDLPPSLTELLIDDVPQYGGEYAYDLDHLPASLLKLDLRRLFTRSLDKLPSSLHWLACPRGFNHPVNHLPSSLTHLCLANAVHFNQPVDQLPAQLQVLRLGGLFNQPLNALPSSLTVLQLDSVYSHFNQPLDHLPSQLTELSLGGAFVRPLGVLPPGLLHLDLACASSFNQPLDGLPQSLQALQLGYSFNQPLPLSLPPSLTILCLGRSFEQFLPLTSLPEGLTYLQLPPRYVNKRPGYGNADVIRWQCPRAKLVIRGHFH